MTDPSECRELLEWLRKREEELEQRADAMRGDPESVYDESATMQRYANALAALLAENEWRPIDDETPKDGTIIDVWQAFSNGSGKRRTDVFFANGAWRSPDEYDGIDYGLEWGPDLYGQFAKLTHWRPLPQPPKGEGE